MPNVTYGLLKAHLLRCVDRSCRKWLGPTDVSACVSRESLRVRRMGGEFSVVLFGIAPWRRENCVGAIQQFTRLLDKRARKSDSLGWIDHNILCAVLPSTPTNGAARFIDDVCHLLAGPLEAAGTRASNIIPPPVCRVHTYPSLWFVNSFEDSAAFEPAITVPPRIMALPGRRLVNVGFGDRQVGEMIEEGLKAI
jgi:hypothetical protein